MPTGTKIKEIRKQKGLTQKQLGDLCGMADSAIRRYENGNANPKIETLQKIADALGCDLVDLMDPDEYKLHNIELAIKKANSSVLNDEGTNVRLENSKGYKKLINEIVARAQIFDDDYTPEEIKKIMEYAEFLKSRRNELLTGASAATSKLKTEKELSIIEPPEDNT